MLILMPPEIILGTVSGVCITLWETNGAELLNSGILCIIFWN